MRDLANLGLQAFFDLGEDGWNDEVDLNFLKLSVLTQGGVIDKVAATPGAPADKDVYIFDETHPTQANKVAVYDVDTWKYFTPNEGWMLYNRADNFFELFDGAVWAEFQSGFEDAPADGKTYGRKDAAWAEIVAGGGGGGGAPLAKGVVLTRAANLAVGGNATVTVPFTAEVIDENNFWDAAAPTNIVFASAGWYICTFDYNRLATAPDQFEDVDFYVNGAKIDGQRQWFPSSYADSNTTAPFIYKFAAGDVLTVKLVSYGTAGTFNGIRFAAVPAGGSKGDTGNAGGAYETIANVRLAADGTFPAIDVAGFRSVIIYFNLKKAGGASDITGASLRFNGDASAVYYAQNGYTTSGSSAADGQAAGANAGGFALMGVVDPGNTKLAANGSVEIEGLDSPLFTAGWIGRSVSYRNADARTYNYRSAGFYNKPDVVNTINLIDNFATGSSIQVVGIRADAIPKANGALIAGDIVLLEERTIPTGAATVDFIGLITEAYRDYVIEISNLVLSAPGNQLRMRYSTDNGATFDATGKYTSSVFQANEGSFASTLNDGPNQTSFQLVGTSNGSANDAFSAIFNLHNPSHAAGYKGVTGQSFTQANDGACYVRQMGGHYKNNAAVNAFRILPTAGTITSGIIRIYGKRKVTASANISVTAGAAFPVGPAVDQRFYRTDRKIEYVWDGARWLSTQLFSLTLPDMGGASDDKTNYWIVPWKGTYSLWLERFEAVGFRGSAGEWDLILSWVTAADAPTVIATLDGVGDPSAAWVNDGVNIGAVLDANALAMRVTLDEVSGASAFEASAILHYRLIG